MKQSTGISSKALVIGAILIPVNCYWVVQMEVVRYSGHPTVFSIFFNVILSVFLLVLVSLILSKLSPKLALSQGELLTIYVMLSIASGLSGRSMIQLLVPELGHPFWFATPENEWKDLFWMHIPRWLAVDDMSVLEEYYRGESTLYRLDHLKSWLPPVIAWGTFTCALVFVMLGCSVGLYAATKLIFGRQAYAMQSKATVSHVARRVVGVKGLLVLLPFAAVIALALLPHMRRQDLRDAVHSSLLDEDVRVVARRILEGT